MRNVLFLLFLISPLLAIEYPSPPQEPAVREPIADNAEKSSRGRKSKTNPAKVPLTTMRLRIHLGDKSVLVAEAAIPVTYSFTHKKGQIQYNQTVRAEDIRELTIESYRARRVASAKDGEVYEFEPAQVRIELKDGQVFKLQYLFKELRKIKAKNGDGAFTVFAFFADTWRGKNGWQERDGEPFVKQTRRTHPAAFNRLEYFEPVDKGSAAGDSASKQSETKP